VQTRQFTLEIRDDLQIAPADGLAFSRSLAGPFAITNQSFTLTNRGSSTVAWTVGSTSAWFNSNPSGGLIAPAGSVSATVSLTSATLNLGIGTFPNTIWFTNTDDNVVQSRAINISVWPWIVNGGFETDDFTGWTRSGSTVGLRVTPKPNKVHSGKFGLALGSLGSAGYVSQAVPTTPGGRYLLSLWLHSPDGQTPNQFEVRWNGTSLYNATNLPTFPWTNLVFVVSATSASTRLEIGGRDDPTALGVDDVSVVPITPPAFRGAIKSGNTVTLSWSGQVGLDYQVRYATALDLPDWTDLGNVINATNGTIVLSDPIVPDSNKMRFYRVLLVP
jgi:hypothetical protein